MNEMKVNAHGEPDPKGDFKILVPNNVDPKWEALYIAVNEMMSPLGAHGNICARDDRVTAVMDALHDLDGGVYDITRIKMQLPL